MSSPIFTSRSGQSRPPPNNSPIRERCCDQTKFSCAQADARCVTRKAANEKLAWAYKLRAQHFQKYLFHDQLTSSSPEGTLELEMQRQVCTFSSKYAGRAVNHADYRCHADGFNRYFPIQRIGVVVVCCSVRRVDRCRHEVRGLQGDVGEQFSGQHPVLLQAGRRRGVVEIRSWDVLLRCCSGEDLLGAVGVQCTR